jgi:hypothetical protein
MKSLTWNILRFTAHGEPRPAHRTSDRNRQGGTYQISLQVFPNSAQVGCGYKDQCLKLADVRRNGIDQVVVIPCRRSRNYTLVVGDLD